MDQQTEDDLVDVVACIESIHKRVSSMTLKTKIDVAARLGSVAKHIEEMDEAIKDEIKAKANGKICEVLGGMFKAFVNIFPVNRLNQKLLEVNHPRIYAKCRETKDQTTVTFGPR